MQLEGDKLKFFVQEFLRKHEDLVEGYVGGDYAPKDELVDLILEESKGLADPKTAVFIMNQELAERL